jgi:membrane-associated phospholipid phosphatase
MSVVVARTGAGRGRIVHTADAQEWLSLGLMAIWVVAAIVAMTSRRLARRPPRGTMIAAGVAAALFAAYAGVVDAVADPAPLAAVDGPTLRWMIDHRTALVNPVMVEISNLGGTAGMTVLTAIAFGLLAWKRHYRDAAVVVVAGAVAGPLVSGFKHLYARERPPVATQLVFEPTYALPSGHALSSTVVVGILTVVAVRMLGSTAYRILAVCAGASIIVVIGVSRLYLGVHWLTDVLAGWFLGGTWLALCTAVLLLDRGSSVGGRSSEGLAEGEASDRRPEPRDEAGRHVEQGEEAGAVLGQPDRLEAERAVGGQGAAESRPDGGDDHRWHIVVAGQTDEGAQDERADHVDDERAPGEHRVVAGLDGPVRQVAGRGAQGGAEADHQQGHRDA